MAETGIHFLLDAVDQADAQYQQQKQYFIASMQPLLRVLGLPGPLSPLPQQSRGRKRVWKQAAGGKENRGFDHVVCSSPRSKRVTTGKRFQKVEEGVESDHAVAGFGKAGFVVEGSCRQAEVQQQVVIKSEEPEQDHGGEAELGKSDQRLEDRQPNKEQKTNKKQQQQEHFQPEDIPCEVEGDAVLLVEAEVKRPAELATSVELEQRVELDISDERRDSPSDAAEQQARPRNSLQFAEPTVDEEEVVEVRRRDETYAKSVEHEAKNSEMPSKSFGLVSSMPLVIQQQPAEALANGKKEVRVKALEAAEAARKLDEKWSDCGVEGSSRQADVQQVVVESKEAEQDHCGEVELGKPEERLEDRQPSEEQNTKKKQQQEEHFQPEKILCEVGEGDAVLLVEAGVKHPAELATSVELEISDERRDSPSGAGIVAEQQTRQRNSPQVAEPGCAAEDERRDSFADAGNRFVESAIELEQRLEEQEASEQPNEAEVEESEHEQDEERVEDEELYLAVAESDSRVSSMEPGTRAEFVEPDAVDEQLEAFQFVEPRCTADEQQETESANKLRSPVHLVVDEEEEVEISRRRDETDETGTKSVDNEAKNSEMPSKSFNLVSSMRSFLPLVIQQQPTVAIANGKKEVRVKALEAAEAARKLEEKRAEERKERKLRLSKRALGVSTRSKPPRKLVAEDHRKKDEELKKKRKAMEEAERDMKRHKRLEKEKENERRRKADEEVKASWLASKEADRKRREETFQRMKVLEKEQRRHVVVEKILQKQPTVDAATASTSASQNLYMPREMSLGLLGHALRVPMGTTQRKTVSLSTLRSNFNAKHSMSGGEIYPGTPVVKSSFDERKQLYSTPFGGDVGGEDEEDDEDGPVSYEISPYKNSDDEEDEEEENEIKPIPSWARREKLSHQLLRQAHVDPDKIFSSAKSCSLNEVFGTTGNLKRRNFAERAGSGDWMADIATWKEELLYKKAMGYS